MNIIENYDHILSFSQDTDSPPKYVNKWNLLKKVCQNMDEDGDKYNLIKEIRSHFKLESNKNLPNLNRCEGGFGGDDNSIHKQIRFRTRHNNIDKNIELFVYSAKIEKWTYEELDDIICSIIKVLTSRLCAKCVQGYIKMTKNIYCDDKIF
jgi:hypothetical protein